MRTVLTVLLGALVFGAWADAPATAQQDAPQIKRDQAEILRKAERLRSLMQSLLNRYSEEGRVEQVKLLREGLEHLQESGLLDDVADVRHNLDSGAYQEALRKQAEIIKDLESLLDILLERRSVESLDEEIEKTEELIAEASELLRRETELQAETRSTRDDENSAAERALQEQLAELARELERESEENRRQAGLRRPVLEAALDSVLQLLREQDLLDNDVQNRGAASPTRAMSFQIGEYEQAQKDALDERSRQRDLERLAKAADAMRSAAETGDRAGARQLRDRLRAALEALANRAVAAGRPQPDVDEQARKLAENSNHDADAATGEQAAEQARELRELGEQIRDALRERADRAAERAARRQGELREQAGRLAEALGADAEQERRNAATRRALEKAAEALQRAAEADRAEDPGRALAESSEALRRTAEARRQFRDANPDARTRAGSMAARADQTAQNLRNAPMGEQAEEDAADALEAAEQALRDAADELEGEERGEAKADEQRIADDLGQSRQALERAANELRQALDESTRGRQEALDRARERQQQLAQRAGEAREALDRAQQQGDIAEAQNQGAQSAMEQAQQAMERANQSLQQGRQSNASRQQQDASDAIEQAKDALEQNRPVSDAEREALQQLAQQQEEIAEDIIRLAELVEERKNRRAEDALREAARAAERAQQAMQRGDREETDEQQQEARDRLQEAQEALEEERDRYQDLRQEELLFRIKEELEQFLERQRPITQSTAEASERLRDGSRLTRPMRRQLNQLGEQEQELASKAKFIHEALADEGTLVFTHVLESNEDDLEEVARRLGGRRPDPGEYTVVLQRDVEERTEKLLVALERERQRRQEENQQQQQQGQNQNQFGPQRRRLVPVLAELRMLKQMEEEMLERTRQMEQLIAAAGADGVSVAELAMAERLAHQHNALTGIFLKLKAQVEEALKPPEQDGMRTDGEDKDKDEDKGEGK